MTTSNKELEAIKARIEEILVPTKLLRLNIEIDYLREMVVVNYTDVLSIEHHDDFTALSELK